jgi:pimeloyl-ACP methyl ester carboxylesterase
MSIDNYIEILRASALKMGKCDPLWLKKEITPEVSYSEHGSSGPEMLLLHGLFGAVSNWDDLTPIVAKYTKITALKFPLLSAHNSEVRVKSLALLTEFFLRERASGPVVLCGNSLGGHVALRLTLAAPELVKALILTGASGLYEHTADSLPIRPGYKFVKQHMSKVFYNQRFITDEAVQEIVDILEAKGNVLNLIHAARSAKRDNLHSNLANINVPTLLLWGEDDHITPMDVARTFNEQIKGSELHSIKDCGHAPMIEHPVWFAEKVKNFLEKNNLL